MSQSRASAKPRTKRLERPLLASCAIGLALVAIARAPEACAQSFNGNAPDLPTYSITTSTGRTDIQVLAPRVVINWQPNDTSAGGTPIAFQDAPTTATDGAFFTSATDFTVLNRIMPTGAAVGRAIALNGRVVSQITDGSTPPVTGGNVWFYSPGGIAIGPDATFDVGSMLLSTLDVTDADFLDGGPYSFSGPADSTAAITVAGATINALNENSYIAMIAPRVVQGGSVNVNGSAAYVAGEQATIDIANGLFSIDVTSGTTDPNGIVHQGITSGPAFDGVGDPHRITMVAVPKNTAITMLVGGDIGYAAAGAGFVNGTVQLYAGYDIPDGAKEVANGPASDMVISGVDLSSDTTAFASRDISLLANDSTGSSFATGDVTLFADRNATLSATRDIFIGGNLRLDGGSAASATLDFETGYGGALDVLGNLLIDASGDGTVSGGIGTGGIAELVMNEGSVAVTGSLSVLADGIGASDGSDGIGGTARLNATAGTLTAGTIAISAGGTGGTGTFSSSGSTTPGGAGRGGNATLTLGGTALINTASLDILAVGSGGEGGSTSQSAASVGGAGTGGTAELTILGGTLFVPTMRLDAGGQGGQGGTSFDTGTPAAGGIGTGGTARLFSDGDFFTIADLMIAARGTGGSGGREFGYGQGAAGGRGSGGSAALDLDFDPIIDVLLVDTSGFGGAGGDGAIGGIGGDGFGGINTGGVGGANLNLTFGALTVHNATIISDGSGGNGGSGSDGSGGNGGNGTGGDARILVSGTGSILTLSPDPSRGSTRLSATGFGGNAGSGTTTSAGAGAAGRNGGTGTGGTARFDILNGGQVLAGPFVSIEAVGFGGGASGGTDGSTGGMGGNGGPATGGTALLNIDGGSLLPFDTAAPLDWTVNANASGGNAGGGGDGTTIGGNGGNGGIARAGTARIIANNTVFDLGSIFIDAEGFGGNGSFGATGAVDGLGGDGFGGIAGFANSDDGTTPPSGARSVVSLDMRAEGTTGPVGDTSGTPGFAGRVELTDTASTSGGSLQLGSLLASSRGQMGTPGAGFHLTSTGGALTVSGTATVDTGDTAVFNFDDNGRFVADGGLFVTAGGDITITHTNQPAGAPVDSISGSLLNFGTAGNFSSDAASILRSTSSTIIFAAGDIAAGNLFAVNRIAAQAGGNLTLGNAGVNGSVSPPFGGAPTNGVIDLAAGNGSSGFVPADITLTGAIAATGHILAQAGGDIIVAGGASVVSDNRITFRSGDDILVRAGGLVRAAVNPLPEFGYGVSGPLDEPALLDFDAGAISVTPVNPANVAAIIVDGVIGAPDRAVTLTAGAIQADVNAIDSKNFYASLRGVPAAGTPANNDGGQLRADCVAGNICLGALRASNIVRIGPETGTIDLPSRIAVAGTIDALDIVIRARDEIAFGGPAAIHGGDRLFIAVLDGDITGTGAFALSGDNLVNVYAGGDIVAPLGTVRAAGNLGLFAGGNIELGTIDAGALLQTIDSDGAVTRPDGLSIAGSITLNTQLAVRGGDALLSAGTGVDVESVLVGNGNNIDLFTSAGLARLGAAGQAGLGTPTNIALTGDSVDAGTLSASGDIGLRALNGNLTAGQLSAGVNLTLESFTGNVSATGASAGAGLVITAAQGASVQTGSAGTYFEVAAQSIDAGTVSAGDDVLLNATGGTLSVASATAGDDIFVNNTGGAIDAASLRTTGLGDDGAFGPIAGEAGPAGSIVRVLAQGNVAVQSADSAGRTAIVSRTGSLGIGSIAAPEATALLAATTVTLDTASTGQLLIGNASQESALAADFTAAAIAAATAVRTGGAVTINDAVTANRIAIGAGGALGFYTLNATGDVALSAAGAVIGTAVDAGGTLAVDAGGGTSFATLGAASGITIQSGGAVAVTQDIASAGAIRVTGTSLALAAIGDLTVIDGQASAGNLALTAGGALNAVATRASGDVTLSAGTNLLVGTADADGNFSGTAQGRADFSGVVAGDTVTVTSRDIGIGANGQLGTIGTTTAVNLTNIDASRQTFIGGADSSAGYSLSAAEIARIFGGSIGVTAPRVAGQSSLSVGSSRAPDVVVGAFTLTGRAGGASGNLGSGALTITTPGKLRFTGAVQLTGLTTANRFEITATDALEIDAASGSIDMRDTASGLSGVLQLTSDDIIAASLQAISDVGVATTTDAIDDRLGINDGAVSDDGYLRANRIEVTARNGFYVQNSGASDDFVDRRGFTVGAGGMGITTGSTSSRIVINGRQSDGAGGFVTGVDLIDVVRINGQTGRGVTGIDRRSTINGCLIANPLLCAGFFIPETALSRDIFEDPLDPESGEDKAGQLFPLTLIELRDFEPFGFEPLIDEPVTGAGNDDLWVPECDPATEQCEAPQQQ